MKLDHCLRFRISRRWLAAAALLAAASGSSSAAESAVILRVGAAHEDITPETSVLNWVTGKPYGSVLDPICVQVLVLDDGRSKAAVVRWDLVDVGESARDAVRSAVGAALHLPGENILVNASHNHSAPWAPVYQGGYRGKERDTWWAIRYMPAQNDFPPFKRWMDKLIAQTVKAAQAAAASAQPVTVSIGRIDVGDYLYNRRPRQPAWGVEGKAPAGYNFNHPDWHPDVLVGGDRFGPVDRTMTLVWFRDAANQPVASFFHLAAHAVAIYPSNPAISADWPGATRRRFTAAFGGENLFLQGCAGDINPGRRGQAAVADMAAGLTAKAQIAARYAVQLKIGPIRTGHVKVVLPLTPAAEKRLDAKTVDGEVQAIVCGPLAIVALPGEPMTELGNAIREHSPFPQTLVLGYSNGNGVHYVGMPGEKARGGYEAGVAGAGTDECGAILVAAANGLLDGLAAQSH